MQSWDGGWVCMPQWGNQESQHNQLFMIAHTTDKQWTLLGTCVYYGELPHNKTQVHPTMNTQNGYQ